MMARDDFFKLANDFFTKWKEEVAAGKKFEYTHLLVIGTVDGRELNTMVYVKAESAVDTLENMQVQVMKELWNFTPRVSPINARTRMELNRPETKAEAIAFSVMKEFHDRAGFQEVFTTIDEERLEDIIISLTKRIDILL